MLAATLTVLVLALAGCSSEEEARVLVFTKTDGYRHGSIDEGVEALREIGATEGFVVDTTESASAFTEENLERYRAVVFLNTSGDVLDYHQQADFERYIQAGGGFMGIHSAADTERDWPWYGELVGAYFDAPLSETERIGARMLTVADEAHPATDSLPATWEWTDEWFRYASVDSDVHVLVTAEDGRGGRVPFAWVQEHDGGRVFFTAGGHTPEAFSEPEFRQHLAGGLRFAVGDEAPDFRQARTKRLPEENRFSQVVLAENLNEPTELVLLGNGRVLFTERKGAVRLYDPEAGAVRQIAQFDVWTGEEYGLMGVALDPNFAENNWVYFYYSPREGEPRQHLSRFELRGDSLSMESEKVVLVVPVQHEECCHTGGSVEFGPDGLLYLSTGDDSNPFQSQGFDPIDERTGRQPFDAQRTSANTNDLRGKILRIRPLPDGTYEIPEGNLFPPGTPNARPEIYVMGNRNPYRISVDQKTGYLYWGEVGPDAGNDDPARGPRGYDEINQAREAGFFGWPYFIADNKAYRDYDFATGRSGAPFDPANPVNASPNNTGLRELPPAQPAFIWYPYAESPEFPIVGTGGRNAMAGPVFYADAYTRTEKSFPEYYDGKLIVYDWIRGWMLAATMDEEGDLQQLEPIMPSTRFHNPIDMAFDENGVLYLLEYGTGWFTQNPDARLSRIEYNAGNRPPAVVVAADQTLGPAPLAVQLSSEGTNDPDGDDLTYTWDIVPGGGVEETRPNPTYTFETPGVYTPTLTVTDGAGNVATARLEIRVGNTPPEVALEIEGNSTFFWDESRLDYRVEVADAEDGTLASGSVRPEDVRLQFDYLPQGFDQTEIAQGHQSSAEAPVFHEGLRLIEGSDCQACHKTAEKSIGPSYLAVAERYADQEGAVEQLAAKIIEGGAGNWGEQAMAAHPQVSTSEAELMVEYILSLGAEQQASRPLEGTFATRAHLDPDVDSQEGTYILRAAYTDRGGQGIDPITSQDVVVLRHPRVEAERFDDASNVGRLVGSRDEPTFVRNLFDGSWLLFRQLDLTNVQQLVFRTSTMPLNESGGTIEVRLDAPDGPVVGRADVPAGAGAPREVAAEITPTEGRHDLYFVIRNPEVRSDPLFLLDWIRFDNRRRAL